MASGALPPGFPAVRIGDDLYWDGGLVSNTPLTQVLGGHPHANTLVFQVDLWSAEGDPPRNLGEVDELKRIAVADGALRRSASLAYGWPLLTLLAGALAGSAAYGEGGAMVGALGGLSIAWFALHLRSRFGKPTAHPAQP